MRLTFWQYVAYFTLPAVAHFSLSGLIASVFMLRLPPWLAFPLGLFLGTVILALWIAGQGGASTVVELNMASAILLILLGLLVPAIIKTRHARLHPHHRTHSQPASHGAPSQKKILP